MERVVLPNHGPASSTPLTGSIVTPVAGEIGPFKPQLDRDIVLMIIGSNLTGTFQWKRSVDGGATKWPVTKMTSLVGDYSSTAFTGVVINEAVCHPTCDDDLYYLDCNISTGTFTFDIRQ